MSLVLEDRLTGGKLACSYVCRVSFVWLYCLGISSLETPDRSLRSDSKSLCFGSSLLSTVGWCNLRLPVDNRSPTATLVRDDGMADCILLFPLLLTVTMLPVGTAAGTVDDFGRSLLPSTFGLAAMWYERWLT